MERVSLPSMTQSQDGASNPSLTRSTFVTTSISRSLNMPMTRSRRAGWSVPSTCAAFTPRSVRSSATAIECRRLTPKKMADRPSRVAHVCSAGSGDHPAGHSLIE